VPAKIKLLPCPFCGGKAESWYDRESKGCVALGDDDHVGCRNCNISFSATCEEDAADKWNRRFVKELL